MTVLSISEAVSVQFPMVKHADEVGWTPLTPDGPKLLEYNVRFEGLPAGSLRHRSRLPARNRSSA